MRTGPPPRPRPARPGFTLIELLVALVFMVVVGAAIASTSRLTAGVATRAGLELRLLEASESELDRLLAIPYDSLVSGARDVPLGRLEWTVADSAGYRTVLLVTTLALADRTSGDTLFAYRLP
ncbi:MAG TPA: hypothetical protein VMM12_16225 [Longimicrobiales bacterium]|nr:hypothetical protein [Longimicrobiales bacterium]